MVELAESAGGGEVTTPEVRMELSRAVQEVLDEPEKLGATREDLGVRITARVFVLLDQAEAQALPEPTVEGQYGERWGTEDAHWMVVRTAEGVDVWTHPTEPLQRADVLALAAALRAAVAIGQDGED